MSSFELERRKRVGVQLNIAPLLDIVFLLLVFFVLSSHFVMDKGFSIKLPKAVCAQSQKSDKLTIFIRPNEDVFLEDCRVELDSLAMLLNSELMKNDSRTVVIKSDEKVNVGFLVKVMDVAKAANVEGLVISTRVGNNEGR